MSRLSDYFNYINAEKTPTANDIQFGYNSLTITEEIKRARYEHRLKLNKDKKNGALIQKG